MNPSIPYPNQPEKDACIQVEALMEYAEGKLEREQVRWVEKHLAVCPLCSDALEGILAFADNKEFMRSVNELNEKVKTSPSRQKSDSEFSKPRGRFLTFPKIAAIITSVAAILLVVLMVMPGGPAKLASDYYETYPGNEVRGEDAAAAMKLYNEGRFGEAATLFSKETDSQSRFFAGCAFMETKSWDKAIECYLQVIKANDSFLSGDAKFYLGLAYLFQSDTENAKQWLKEVAADANGDYADEADSILKKLE